MFLLLPPRITCAQVDCGLEESPGLFKLGATVRQHGNAAPLENTKINSGLHYLRRAAYLRYLSARKRVYDSNSECR